jgi:prepilin-type N-terminal cleavage/methylation domain-containing protein
MKKEMVMKLQKGFTLIELMVVIVIIGILSALAVPKMFGTSAKAKAAEAPSVIKNWETLQSSYVQERSAVGTWTDIGFKDPGTESKWFLYTNPTNDVIVATTRAGFGDCALGDTYSSVFDPATDASVHAVSSAACGTYVPNFLP